MTNKLLSVKEQFKQNLPVCYNVFGIHYTNKSINEEVEELWESYGDDIMAFLDGIFPENWEAEGEPLKLVNDEYKKFVRTNTGPSLTIEEWWSNLVREAMMANAENLFNEEGPCDFNGKLMED